MSELKERAVRELERAIGRLNSYVASYNRMNLRTDEYHAAMTTALETVRRWAPPGSSYLVKAEKARNDSYYQSSAQSVSGVLIGLRDDYADDCVNTVVDIVHADTFADLLEQGAYLLENGYALAAAVIIGSALEAHLRALCVKHGLPVAGPNGRPKTGSALTAELQTRGVYGQLDHKNVLAWQELRNAAAHGKGGFTDDQVDTMLSGVRNFIPRYPA